MKHILHLRAATSENWVLGLKSFASRVLRPASREDDGLRSITRGARAVTIETQKAQDS